MATLTSRVRSSNDLASASDGNQQKTNQNAILLAYRAKNTIP